MWGTLRDKHLSLLSVVNLKFKSNSSPPVQTHLIALTRSLSGSSIKQQTALRFSLSGHLLLLLTRTCWFLVSVSAFISQIEMGFNLIGKDILMHLSSWELYAAMYVVSSEIFRCILRQIYDPSLSVSQKPFLQTLANYWNSTLSFAFFFLVLSY